MYSKVMAFIGDGYEKQVQYSRTHTTQLRWQRPDLRCFSCVLLYYTCFSTLSVPTEAVNLHFELVGLGSCCMLYGNVTASIARTALKGRYSTFGHAQCSLDSKGVTSACLS